MKKWIVCGFAGLLSACAGIGGVNMPRIIAGDADGFVIYDENGVSQKKGLDVATYYCAQLSKTAEFQSKGGASPDCVSSQLNFCVTYSCK